MTYPRELEVTYGDLVVGGASTTYLLDGVHVLRHGFLTSEVEFSFVAVGTSEAAFEDACRRAEDALREPDQSLKIRQGGSTLVDLSQDQDTGLDAMPTITKAGDEHDTGRSRTYRARIEFGRPGGRADVDGLRRSSVTLAYSPARVRTMTIEGEFTAVNGTDARAQYEAKIDAMATAATTAFGGTWELASEDASNTTNDKSVTFRRVYDEVIYAQGTGGTADAAIVRQTLQVEKTEQNEQGETFPARPLDVSTARWDVSIDAEVTTDLDAKWESIKDWLTARTTEVLGGGIVLSRTPTFDRNANRISATIRVANATRSFIRYSREVSDRLDYGVVLVPVWKDGQRFARYVYDGVARYERTVREDYRSWYSVTHGEAADRHADQVREAMEIPANFRFLKNSAEPKSWVVTQRPEITVRPVELGLDDRTVTDVRCSTTMELIESVGSTTPSGPGGGAVTPPSGG